MHPYQKNAYSAQKCFNAAYARNELAQYSKRLKRPHLKTENSSGLWHEIFFVVDRLIMLAKVFIVHKKLSLYYPVSG
jgi:hypothetical protein